MGKATMIGSFSCQDGKAEEMEAALVSMVEAAKDEPGVEVYSYHRGDGNTFWFFALMSDADSMQHHGQTPAMREAMQAFMPLMAEPPQMQMAAPISAIGLNI